MGLWDLVKARYAKRSGLTDLYQQQQSGLMAKELVGKRQQPYQMSEEELFPGEAQATLAPGLMTKGSGLVGGEITPQEFYGGLMSTPGYQAIGAQGLQNIQSQKGLMARQQAKGVGGFKNVTQDDMGNWYGVNQQGQVQQLPMQEGGQFTKYKTVQSVDPSGRTSVELVAPSLMSGAGQPRIKVGQKGFSGEQSTASGFANRMVGATDTLDKITAKGFDPTSLMDIAAGSIPGARNYLASPEYKQYDQAKKDWVRAKLRKESGAVIGDQEMADEVATYFPVAGDDKDTIRQKAKARWTATQGMVNQSQGAFQAQSPEAFSFYEKYKPTQKTVKFGDLP